MTLSKVNEDVRIKLRHLFLQFQAEMSGRLEDSTTQILDEFIQVCRENNLDHESLWYEIEDDLYPERRKDE